MSKYLVFNEEPTSGKTKKYAVMSAKWDFKLGEVRWFGCWRQYAFFPEAETVFNRECLEDIRVFILDLMLKRKEARA